MIAVTTPNGNIGKNVLSDLVVAQKRVRALSYYPQNLPTTSRTHYDVVAASLDDADALQRALPGVRDLFWCVPQSHRWEKASDYYGGFTTAICKALASLSSSSPRLVGISGGGSGTQDAGILAALGEMEKQINSTGIATRLLRCGYFMENLFWSMETIQASGTIVLPLSATTPLPLVAAKDIAGVAVQWLLDTEWSDQQSPAVYGPVDVTLQEMIQTLSEVLEMPLRYVEISGEKMKMVLREHGAGEGFAAAYVRMCQAFSEGSYRREPRTPEATTSTSLREWTMQNLLPMFQKMEKASPAVR